MNKNRQQEFIAFVCSVCEENLRKPEDKTRFTASLQGSTDKIIDELTYSLEGLAIRAEQRTIFKHRSDVKAIPLPVIVEGLKVHFLS